MQAIEFKSHLGHGQITVPASFHLMAGQSLRVLILLDEKAGGKETKLREAENICGRTAGAWQGEILVRVPQGEFEQRVELELC